MYKLIDATEPKYQLGIARMDHTHQEFIGIVNRLYLAEKTEFQNLFPHLVEHTESHFESENQLMQEFKFPATREHIDEHSRVLGELHRISEMVKNGSFNMARAYVKERLPEWFNLHAMTMDSALAAHIKSIDSPEGQVEIMMNL